MAYDSLTFTIGQILTSTEANQLQTNIDLVRVSHISAAAPAEPQAGAEWWDNSAPAMWIKKIYNGTQWIPHLFNDLVRNEAGPIGGGAGHWGDVLATDVNGNRTEFAGLPYTPRNMLLNANMGYFQRGNSYGVSGENRYVPDRWMVRVNYNPGSNVPQVRASQSSFVPSGSGLYWSLELAVTSNRVVTQSGDLFQVEQMIEGTLARRAMFGTPGARHTRLSFHLWANVTGRVSVLISNASRTATWVTPIDIAVASQWVYYNIGLLRPTSGSWLFDEAIGIRVAFGFAGGTEWRSSTPSAWVYNSPDVRVASGQLNALATTGTTFRITGTQYELGEVATPLEFLPAAILLPLLRRYYFKTFSAPQRPVVNSGTYEGALSVVADITGMPTGQIRLASTMARDPDVSFYSPFAANGKWWRQTVGGNAGDGQKAGAWSPDQAWVNMASPNSAWAGEQMAIHFSADAEFYTS